MPARTRDRGSMQTGRADFYKHGDFNRICDRTGYKVKASQTRKEWQNLIVRKEDYEPRHPQDFVRGRRDRQAVREARSELPDRFLAENEVTADDL